MPSSTDTAEPRPRFPAGPRPRIIAHRGLALEAPENTMRAFEAAVAVGADMLETDCHATRDGVALTVHDPDLRRVGDGDLRRIESLTSTEAAAVRLGGTDAVPRLEDVLGSFDVPVNIDVKAPSAVRPVAEAIARTASASRVCVTSFDGRTARRAAAAVRRLTGILPARSPSVGAMSAFLGAVATGSSQRVVDRILAPYGALQVPPRHRGYPIVTRRSVALANRAGCEVHVWTIDDVDEMRALLALGADGIVTNRSDLLARLLGR